jgi:hypothetical protein
MIVINGRFARYGEIWFDEEPPAHSGVDILMYRLRSTPAASASCTPFMSLVSDVTAEPEALMAGFGRTNRYQIKRADSKDVLTTEFITTPAPHLDAFCAFYDGFAEQKNLPAAYRRGLDASAGAGQLVLSTASHADNVLVWHAYIRWAGTAALLHSASHFRAANGVDRAIVGRANRWLHWKDMLAFRATGVTRYDWGGMFEDETVPEQASINKFKRDFGGADRLLYNCTVATTIKGRVYLAAQRTLDRLKKD